MIELFILLFADDIVLLSDTVTGLQNQLDVLARNCARLDLHVNWDKSNIVIFRNGGYISKKERKKICNGQTLQMLTLTNTWAFSLQLERSFQMLWTKWPIKQGRGLLTYSERFGGLGIFRHISNSTRFTIYRMLKISISLEPYFTSVTNTHSRDLLIRFRIGASNIRTHKLRYVAHTPGDLMCALCKMKCLPYFNCKFLDDMETKIYSQKIYCATFLCYS